MGCLEVDAAALPAAAEAVAREVFQIKARGDRAAAEALRDTYTAEKGDYAELREVITERMNREPRSSFLYRVVIDAP